VENPLGALGGSRSRALRRRGRGRDCQGREQREKQEQGETGGPPEHPPHG
jgi:hypothetical protein